MNYELENICTFAEKLTVHERITMGIYRLW